MALKDELQTPEASALIVSHDRTFARNVGSRICLIRGKHTAEAGTPDDWFCDALG